MNICSRMLGVVAGIVLIAAFSAPGHAAEALAKRPGHAAISSAHGLATDAGFEILAQGGNGFDAFAMNLICYQCAMI